MLPSTSALLGTVLALIDAAREPAPTPLDVVSDDTLAMRILEKMGRNSAVSGATGRVLDAVGADPKTFDRIGEHGRFRWLKRRLAELVPPGPP
jgi:hypothetical protein